jgi:hypothetical protein
MTSLTDRTPKDTYKDLVQVSNSNSGIDGTRRNISDGEGTNAPIKVSTSAAEFTGIVDLSAASLLIAADAILFSNIDWSGTDTLTGEIDVASAASIDFLSGSTLTLATGATFTLPADFIPLSKIDLSGDDTIGGALAVASGASITFVSGSTLSMTTGSTLSLLDDQIPLAKVDLSDDDTISGALAVASGASLTFAAGSSLTVDPNATVSLDGLLDGGALLDSSTGSSLNTSTLGATTPQKIELIFDQVSMNGTDNLLVQIGPSGGVDTSGYLSRSTSLSAGGNGQTTSTAGFIVLVATAATSITGRLVLSNVTGNVWVADGAFDGDGGSVNIVSAGRISASGTVTQVTIKPTGANTFDSGQIKLRAVE